MTFTSLTKTQRTASELHRLYQKSFSAPLLKAESVQLTLNEFNKRLTNIFQLLVRSPIKQNGMFVRPLKYSINLLNVTSKFSPEDSFAIRFSSFKRAKPAGTSAYTKLVIHANVCVCINKHREMYICIMVT